MTQTDLLMEPKYAERLDREMLTAQASLYAQVFGSPGPVLFVDESWALLPGATRRNHGPGCAAAADVARDAEVLARVTAGSPA